MNTYVLSKNAPWAGEESRGLKLLKLLKEASKEASKQVRKQASKRASGQASKRASGQASNRGREQESAGKLFKHNHFYKIFCIFFVKLSINH